MKLITSD